MNSMPITTDSEIYHLFPALKEKFVVDFVNGIDITRDHIRVQSGRTDFMSRMYDGFTGKNVRRQNEINQSLVDGLEGSLLWLEDLTESLSFSNIVLAKTQDKIAEIQHNIANLVNYSVDLKNQLNRFSNSLTIRCNYLAEEITRVDFEQRVLRQITQVFNKWQAGNFETLSIASSLYSILDELWWGDFGDYCRNHTNDIRLGFLDDVKNRIKIQIAEELQTRKNDRLESKVWLSSTFENPDSANALDYLGNWAKPDSHPFVFAATQQNIYEFPLGLPKLFNKSRLADAMIYEIFETRT